MAAKKKGGNQNKAKKEGPGYEGVDPAANCIINKTGKFAVWDAPGVSQPKVEVAAPTTGTASTASTAASSGKEKQRQNNNSKWFQAASPTDAGPTSAVNRKGAVPTITVESRCGSVKIHFPGPAMNRVETCDVDWRKSVDWCTDNLKATKVEQPFVDLVYLPNILEVEGSVDALDVMMIGKGYNSRRIVSRNCGTILLADHPAFEEQKVVVCNSNGAKITGNKTCPELLKAQKRIFEDDLTSTEKAKLFLECPFEEPPTKEKITALPEYDLVKWKQQHPKYTTIQNLMKSLGPLQYMDEKSSAEGTPNTEWNRFLQSASVSGNL